MEFRISASSKTGCVRPNNEDMVLIGQRFLRNEQWNTIVNIDETDRYLVAVADGMGGHNHGEIASSEMLHNLQFFYYDLPVGLSISSFNEVMYVWLTSINNIFLAKGKSNEELRDMGTTMVALAYFSGVFYWMNCGDSRIYRLRDERLEQLSTDHSLNNLIGEKEHSSIVTNCIGAGCKNSFIDIVEIIPQVQKGDVFLLCSDGLSDMISNERLKLFLLNGSDAETLCSEAEVAGGYDNVSAIVVRVE